MERKKSRAWEEAQKRFEHTADRLGMPIDQGILDIIIVLNLLGIMTRQSCEGHLDRGDSAPWVSFTNSETTEIYAQAAQEHARATHMSKEKQHTYEELFELFSPARELRRQADKLHAIDQQKVLGYLNTFYTDQQENMYISHDCMLIIHSRVPGTSILESQGAKLQCIRSNDERALKLQEYQQEMQAFALFLRDRFFEN